MTRSQNIVLVCLDSVRKDFFDAHATDLRNSATLSIDNCRAASSWSVPSHASLITGHLPHQHGVHAHSPSYDTLSEEETLFSSLREYSKIGVSANVFAGTEYGFEKFYDSFDDIRPDRRFPDGMSPSDFESDQTGLLRHAEYLKESLKHENSVDSLKNGLYAIANNKTKAFPIPKIVDDSGSAVLDRAIHQVQNYEEPYFLFINLMDAHIPLQTVRHYDRSGCDVSNNWSSEERTVWELMTNTEDLSEYWEKRETVYGLVIEYLNRLLVEFETKLRQVSSSDPTIIVTADHGENHGHDYENSMANHKSSLSESLLHVPFEILGNPEIKISVGDMSTHLDIPHLIHGLVEGRDVDFSRTIVPAELVGMSMGPDPPMEVDQEFYQRAIRAVYDSHNRKVEWDSLGNSMEYTLDPGTPCWQEEVASGIQIPDRFKQLYDTSIGEYKNHAEAIDSATVSGSAESRLEELGYL